MRRVQQSPKSEQNRRCGGQGQALVAVRKDQMRRNPDAASILVGWFTDEPRRPCGSNLELWIGTALGLKDSVIQVCAAATRLTPTTA